jgi:hypothetical protein
MTGLTWCNRRKTKANGVKVTWEEFQIICSSKDALKAAIKAAKNI